MEVGHGSYGRAVLEQSQSKTPCNNLNEDRDVVTKGGGTVQPETCVAEGEMAIAQLSGAERICQEQLDTMVNKREELDNKEAYKKEVN